MQILTGNSLEYNYKDVLEGFGITQFNKAQAVDFLTKQVNSPQIYIAYAIAMIVYTFIAYFISTFLDIIMLSLFGWITTFIARIQIRYRAIFNMSVYAITISTILQLIYIFVGLFTDFKIKYFDLMYTAISFICLIAAIFMIKSDIIKQQMQIMQMIEIRRQKAQEQQDEEEKEKENDKQPKEDEKKEEDNSEKKEDKDGKVGNDVEGQGSNA